MQHIHSCTLRHKLFKPVFFTYILFFLFWCFGQLLNVDEANGDQGDQDVVPTFQEFGLADLRAATNEFSSDLIVSESGEKAPNVVYRGKLRNNRLVAIKRFSKQSWPDRQQFVVSYVLFYQFTY